MSHIYSLHCPKTGHLRYIGKSRHPQRRFARHLFQAKDASDRSHKANWIRSLLKEGLKPIMLLVQETPEVECNVNEIAFIARARYLGFRLVNATEGGDGIVNPTQEAREKMRRAKLGKPLSDIHKQRLSEARKGNTNRVGKKDSIATRARKRIAHLRRWEKIRQQKAH